MTQQTTVSEATVKAVDFLKSLPGPMIDLTAIHPDGRIIGRTFSKGNAVDLAALAKAIKTANGKGYGIYFNINALGVRLGFDKYPKDHKKAGQTIQKAAEENVPVVQAFHVDADADKSIIDREAFAKAKADLLVAIQGMNTPPTIIVNSGNGYGLFWLLRKPVKVTAENFAKLKGVNVTLRDAVRAMPGGDADACENLDRVMRVPFTINHPNAAKIKRGRTAVPTSLVSDDRTRLYSTEDFEAAPVEAAAPVAESVEAIDIPDTVNLSNLTGRFLKLIKTGPEEERKIGDGTRSAYVFYVVCGLIESGFTDGQIVWVITNPDFKVSEHVLEQKQRGTAGAQAIKIIADAKKRGAKYISPEDEFSADPPEPPTPEQEKEQEDIRDRNARTKPLEIGKRRQIKIAKGKLPRAVDQVQRVIGPQTDERDAIFKRNGRMVHLSRNITDEGVKLRDFEKDALVIQDATRHWTANRLEKSIEFVEYNKKQEDWLPADCPMALVDRILGDSTNWLGYATLYATTETPTLRADGTILDRPGYDRSTGLFYDPGDVQFPPIKQKPTVEEGRLAIKKIDDLLIDFPFVDDVSKSVAMSLYLSSVVRRTMKYAPVYFVDADEFEAGKTTLAKGSGALATGRDIQVQAYASNVEERDKLLPALLLGGAPLLLFDNLPDGCVVEGAELEKVITATSYESRPFGKNDTTRTMPTNVTMVYTGVKMKAKGAMATRGLLIRLVPDKPFAERTFRHKDLVEHIIERRPELVAAILTALRAFLVHGSEIEKDRDRFPGWSELVRSALIWYGYKDPQRGGDKLREDDPIKEAQREVIGAWWRAFADEVVTVKKLAGNEQVKAALAEPLGIRAQDVNGYKARDYVEGLAGVRLGLPVNVVTLAKSKPQRYRLDLKPSGSADWANDVAETDETQPEFGEAEDA